jgi:hypothetical protein
VCTHLHSCALTCVYACVYVCIRLSVKLEHDSMFFQVENNVTTKQRATIEYKITLTGLMQFYIIMSQCTCVYVCVCICVACVNFNV